MKGSRALALLSGEGGEGMLSAGASQPAVRRRQARCCGARFGAAAAHFPASHPGLMPEHVRLSPLAAQQVVAALWG